MSHVDSLLLRNKAFAETDAKNHVPEIPFIPHQLSFVITCVDPRTEPGAFLGVELGDAIVLRSIGGRVTPAVLRDVAYISYLLETKAPDGPWFELAVIHHTDCGSGFLADEQLRHDFAQRGFDEDALAKLPVTDPEQTVRTDVDLLRKDSRVSSRIAVSGHVYDVATGLVRTVVEAG
jgi:carbonic anhydrase